MTKWNEEFKWLKEFKEYGLHKMVVNDHVARIMIAERLKGDKVFDLPPGRMATVFPVDCLPGSPKEWIKGSGSYVVPIESDFGIWFDWKTGDYTQDLNTAIIPSIKGMNPITGRKIDSLRLEEYSHKCPIHNKDFSHSRFCTECGYEWPPQNYVTKDSGEIWLDGFRQPDGSVRQFFFTDEEERDIASAVIGKQNTVPAFGFAFYRPKNPRTPPNNSVMRGVCLDGGMDNSWLDGDLSTYCDTSSVSFNSSTQGYTDEFTMEDSCGGSYKKSGPYQSSLNKKPTFPMPKGKKSSQLTKSMMSRSKSIKVGARNLKSVSKPKKTKTVSVGGGARINQSLKKDSLGLDGWLEKPSAVIRLYFCFEKQFRQIVKDGGVADLKRNPEGYLDGLPVG